MQRYWKMYMHFAWGTRNRSHVIRGRVERAMHQGIRSQAGQLDLVPICVNSAWSHTHALLSWNPALAPDDVVEQLKKAAVTAWSNYRNSSSREIPGLEWQDGYGGFTVSPGEVRRVKRYVALQKKFHRAGRTVDHYETWRAVG